MTDAVVDPPVETGERRDIQITTPMMKTGNVAIAAEVMIGMEIGLVGGIKVAVRRETRKSMSYV